MQPFPNHLCRYCGLLQTSLQSKGKTTEARKKKDTSDVLRFQKKLEDMILLFEKEKKMENGVMTKVVLCSFQFPFIHFFMINVEHIIILQ